jgi:hypothetical protein
MQSVNLRQLRDTKQLKAWLAAGETVELRERNRVLGRIEPDEQKPDTVELPDFEGRLKAIFGDKVLTPVADLIAEREQERY